MKDIDVFKDTIRKYLENRGSKDPLFARIVTKPGKNMEDCVTYILNQVKSMAGGKQAVGLTDDQVYNLAIHYFDEDDITVGSSISNVKIVVNHPVELSEEEKKQAHDIAMKEEIEKARQKILGKDKKPEEKKPDKEKPDAIIKTLF